MFKRRWRWCDQRYVNICIKQQGALTTLSRRYQVKPFVELNILQLWLSNFFFLITSTLYLTVVYLFLIIMTLYLTAATLYMQLYIYI